MERFVLALAVGTLIGLLAFFRRTRRPLPERARGAWLIASAAGIVTYWGMGVW